jgi:hypothetical protein
MGVIVTRNQPQQPVSIDQNNRLGRAAAFLSYAGFAFDAISGVASSTRNAQVAAGRIGLGFSTTGSGKQIEWNLAPLVTSDGAGTGDFTIFAYIDPVSEAASRTIYSQKNDALGAPYTQVGLYVNTTDFSTSTGRLSLSGYSGTGWGAESDTSAIDGAAHLFMAVRRGGLVYLYRDGVPLSLTRRGTQTTVVYRAGQLTALGADANTTNTPYNRIIPLAGSLNIGLTDAEAKDFADNPWQLFRAPERRILVPASASGVTGTVAVTNANDTPSASGTTTVTGSAARANASDTSIASGTTTVSGALAKTNANDTANASGSIGSSLTGSGSTTNASDTGAATGTTSVTGSAARTNSNDAATASGTTAVIGVGAGINGADTSAAAGTTRIIGTVARSNVNDTSSGLGATGTVTGTSATTNADDTAVAYDRAPSTGGGADYGSSKKKRRRVLIGNKTYVVNDAELKRLLEMELLSDDAPEPAKQPPVDPKPLPDPEVAPVVIEAPKPVKPLEFVPVESIEQTQKFKRLMSGLQKQQDERAQMILRQIAEEIEEEDIEFLLLMG